MKTNVHALALLVGLAVANPSSSPTTCPTITRYTTPQPCPPTSGMCTQANCIEVVPVTVPCSCVGDLPLSSTTVAAPCCHLDCATSTEVVYLPCATSVNSPSHTTTTTTTTTSSHKHHTTTSEGPGCPPPGWY